jgi:hypothetical protein
MFTHIHIHTHTHTHRVVVIALFVHTVAYFVIFLNFVGGVFEPRYVNTYTK